MELTEKPVEQPKITLRVTMPESSRIHDKNTPIPDYTIPQIRSRDDSGYRKTIQDMSRDIAIYPDPIYRPLPKPTEIPIQEITRNSLI